jgi:hypothetical protein
MAPLGVNDRSAFCRNFDLKKSFNFINNPAMSIRQVIIAFSSCFCPTWPFDSVRLFRPLKKIKTNLLFVVTLVSARTSCLFEH